MAAFETMAIVCHAADRIFPITCATSDPGRFVLDAVRGMKDLTAAAWPNRNGETQAGKGPCVKKDGSLLTNFHASKRIQDAKYNSTFGCRFRLNGSLCRRIRHGSIPGSAIYACFQYTAQTQLDGTLTGKNGAGASRRISDPRPPPLKLE